MTPDEIADKYLALTEVGTPDQPRHRLDLVIPQEGGLPRVVYELGQGASLASRRALIKLYLLSMLRYAQENMDPGPSEAAEGRDVFDRLRETADDNP